MPKITKWEDAPEREKPSYEELEADAASMWYELAYAQDRIRELERLVRDMWDGMCNYDHDCRYCKHYRTDGASFGECVFRMRMIELGVTEVD